MLKTLVVANLLASGAHFAHNAVFLAAYPGPAWIPGPWFVVVAWVPVAFVLIAGYRWHAERTPRRALAAMSAYCLSCLLVFSHYLYGAPSELDLLANLLIFAEGIGGVALLVYFVAVARRRPQATPA